MIFRSKDSDGLREMSLELHEMSVPGKVELTRRVEELYHEYYDSVYRYLVLTGSTPSDADEFVQEAFLRLFRSLKAGQSIEKPKSWLVSVAHNLRLRERRKDDRTTSGTEGPAHHPVALQVDPGLDPESALLQRERLDHVQSAMARLTER